MSFFCPTFQRPERLRDLADSWQEYAYGMPLKVRIWSGDPHREEYEKQIWPDDWSLYVDNNEWTGPALEAFFQENRDADYFGFIGDDVILSSENAIENLVQEAGKWYIAYPNDKIQRHRLCTHFCIGGELVREVGYLVPPGIKHHYLDQIWMTIGLNTGLLRYRPDVIFDHQHFLREKAELDPTYLRIYGADGQIREKQELEAQNIFKLWVDKRAGKDIGKIKRKLLSLYEDFDLNKWEQENGS